LDINRATFAGGPFFLDLFHVEWSKAVKSFLSEYGAKMTCGQARDEKSDYNQNMDGLF
jgi:hypothetical protein